MSCLLNDDAECDKSPAAIRPFEWLTSPLSLRPLIEEHSSKIPNQKALHVGCGSSTVSEFLLEELNFHFVVDLDKDQETMDKMKLRWQHQRQQHQTITTTNKRIQKNDDGKQQQQQRKLEFCVLDFTKAPIPYEDDFFGLILDKSTLDCTLCSDNATASLLTQVYRCLAVDGIYLLISFHEKDLLIPLLTEMPGTNWEVTCTTMQRQVESLMTTTTIGDNSSKNAMASTSVEEERPGDTCTNTENPSSKPLNVIIARKLEPSSSSSSSSADDDHGAFLESVCQHVHEVNDTWFQQHQPLLTRARTQELKDCFAESSSLGLEQAYKVMFTEAEREHLTYEHFLEDWQAFLTGKDDLVEGGTTTLISFDVALAFLNEMQ